MSGRGDPIIYHDSKQKDGSIVHDEVNHAREDLEIKPLANPQQRYTKNLLTNARKSFILFEEQSLIDCLDADEEYIVSAGRDHDINVWIDELCLGRHICRLTGHHAPVTGLSVFNSGHLNFDKIIVSSSEDGSIRIWSLSKGVELKKIETGNIITCMGIMNKSLAVIGNNKGYMEVYHIRSGDLYTSIRAHTDPVDALEVDGNYAFTATFEDPSCLKVWDIQFEQTRCIYRLQNLIVEFCCLSVWNLKAVLGASNEAKLFIVDCEKDVMEIIDLYRPSGKIERVKVWNEWILSCSNQKKEVLLDVHRFHNYEHFGTFDPRVQQIKAITPVEFDNCLKIIIGGSSLVRLSFDFILTDEETDIPYSRFPITEEKNMNKQNKEKSNYTMKYTYFKDRSDEDSINSSDDSDVKYQVLQSCNENIGDNTLQSGYDNHGFKEDNRYCFVPLLKEVETDSCNPNRSLSCTPQTSSDEFYRENIHIEDLEVEHPISPSQTKAPSVLTVVEKDECRNTDMISFSPIHDIREPRLAIRKLEEELDKNNEGESKNFTKSNDLDEVKTYIMMVKDINAKEHTAESKDAELLELKYANPVEESEVNNTEPTKVINDIKETESFPVNEILSEKETAKREIQDVNITKPCDNDISSKKKSKTEKKAKKRESKKPKCRKCVIM